MKEKACIRTRLEQLKKEMEREGISYYLLPTNDYHQSEYVSDYFKLREYFSGFTGSNGTLLVSQKETGLWTDGRYFVQAALELEGSGITLFKEGEKDVPTIFEYLSIQGKAGETLAFDGGVVSASYGLALEEILIKKEMHLQFDKDVAGSLWEERPSLPEGKIQLLENYVSGKPVEEKLAEVRKRMEKSATSYLVLSKLDDIMWLFNIRGTDVAYNMVALSYAFVTEQECYLFLRENAVTEEQKEVFLKKQVAIKKYEEVTDFLKSYSYQGKVLCDIKAISFSVYQNLKSRAELVQGKNPTERLKAIKNPKEIENLREIYLKDSAILTKFLYWLKQRIGKEMLTEASVAEYLDRLRLQTEGCLDLSFPTISAYRENAAMMHYEATKESAKVLEPKDMLLVDSGGQYVGGTTDVTRTIVLGEISKEARRHFTAVVSGMLQLQNAHFLYGCTGRNLDILARQPLWDLHMDYKCGTGHGVGYMLNVHEGPQSFRWKYQPLTEEGLLEEGMITSNEPGVYLEGQYGIRIENVILCKQETENGDGTFMAFEPLTYVPIDLEGIAVELLSAENKKRLNEYHKKVSEKLSPFLKKEEVAWLKEVTKEI